MKWIQTKKAKVVLAMLLGSTLANAQTTTQDAVRLQDGTALLGHVEGMEAGFLQLSVSLQDVSGLRRIPISDIATVTLWDHKELDSILSDDGQTPELAMQKARPHLFRRVPLLGLLDASEEALLLAYLELNVHAGNALESLAYAKLWSPKLSTPENRKRCRSLLIELALAAGAQEEALVHAERCIAVDQDAATPLAWHVLAENHLARGRPEKALWTSLAPIAQSINPPSDQLATCYRSALKAATQMGLATYAASLRQEYAERFHELAPAPHPTSDTTPPTLSLLQNRLSWQDLLKSNSTLNPTEK